MNTSKILRSLNPGKESKKQLLLAQSTPYILLKVSNRFLRSISNRFHAKKIRKVCGEFSSRNMVYSHRYFFTVYAILDSFDSGVGFWYLFLPFEERQFLLNKIRRSWIANKLWLLAGLTALFITFPRVFIFVVGSFYPVIIIVAGIFVFRTLAIKLRNIVRNNFWITAWDIIFAIGGYVLPFVIGIAAGNILMGVPLDRNGHYAGTFSDLFSRYSIAAGLIGIVIFAIQGSLYLALQAEGITKKRARIWAMISWTGYLILLLYLTVQSVIFHHIIIHFFLHPKLLLVLLCGFIAIITIPFLLWKRKIFAALISSSLSVAVIIATCGISVFPFLVPTFGNIGKSLKISNAAASDETLLTMLVISLVAVPIMAIYTTIVYRNGTRTPEPDKGV